MTAATAVPLLVLVSVIVMMLAELWLSTTNERVLLANGAVQADDPVYAVMRIAYPGVFIAMALEGMMTGVELGPLWGRTTAITFAGVTVMFVAKALKFWAIASLGRRWTYKVLVVPALPPVTTGPYAWMRHPNYVAVAAEIVGFSLLARAPVAGVAGFVVFGALMLARIRVEERALGRARG